MYVNHIYKILLINILLFVSFFNPIYAHQNNQLYPTQTNTHLSVIIPLSPNETAWKNLLKDLVQLPDKTEILFIISNLTKIPAIKNIPRFEQKTIRWIKAKPGRASQMNAGAIAAQGKYLWFLHADSKFAPNTIQCLLHAIDNHPDSLLFFNLVFLNDATPLMHLNTWGTYFRSHILKVPFGDQGFCINKNLFKKLGMYQEELPYGEDHVFTWKAKQQNVSLQPIDATLYTSARKYKIHGWLKTTALTQYLWIKQAIPELIKLYKIKLKQLIKSISI